MSGFVGDEAERLQVLLKKTLEVSAARERKYELATQGLAWWYRVESLRIDNDYLREENERLKRLLDDVTEAGYQTLIDRTGLLSVADELFEERFAADVGIRLSGDELREYARRIRVACGEKGEA